ncbi:MULTISPECIES: glucosaminidase domain-containing protein [unclassified Enterococcus]|uniref:glucosaminidase domain-containing protein n=1 Tax=unclassified Enterococcus TaxID=2608891 RepID=UPI001904C180|nr:MULTISPECIES: glucosaminidase domain-containing protein [unclassified Enterococcus]MBK0039224.1 glucosaminidase domain-containing protein [Enterococcus sp. S52]MBK0071872.1 glucosaminidase domain-containing protein [Enterococcus sp. S53]MBK0142464.1 glucosaminidase domain-containing protein [Enterococcus sp. S76]MBK0146159.1 glucosaminidase domain-containing protein [Enterococcus sp. S77]
MKPKKKHSYLTLFSVGILASQFFISPLLLAEEHTQQLSEYFDPSSREKGQEAIQEVAPIDAAMYVSSPLADEEDLNNTGEEADEQGLQVTTDEIDTVGEFPVSEEDKLEPEAEINDGEAEPGEEATIPEKGEPQPETDENEEDTSIEEEVPVPEEDLTEPEVEGSETGETPPDSSENTEQKEEPASQDPTPPENTIPEQRPAPVIQPPSTQPPLTNDFYDGSITINLPEVFRTTNVTQSSLLGFTLPLLTDYEERWQAAFVYEAIQQVGETAEQETLEQWGTNLYTALLGDDIQWFSLEEVAADALKPGDFLIDPTSETAQLKGIYLANGYQVNLVAAQEENQPEEEQTIELQRIALEETFAVKRLTVTNMTEYGEEVVRDYPAPYAFTANLETQEFIDSLAQDAQSLGQEYDVFASVLIAQAILESGSGSSGLSSSPHYNLFGIKGSHQGQSVILPTMEDNGRGELFEVQAAFRSYGSYRDSMADYVTLIRGGIKENAEFYKEVWRSEAKNYLRATDALTGSYATDVTYNKKLNSLIAAYELTKYDETIETETGVFIQGMDQIPSEYRALMSFPTYNGRDYNLSGSYPVGQCTWYVFNRVTQLGGQVDDYMGNGGQWGSTGRRLGYTVNQRPKAGSMVSFAPGTAGSDPRYGHVAFVEAVGPNGILISEGNVYGGTTISYRVISNELALSSHVSYILPK